MSHNAMTKTIAEYLKTQPVLKAWLFGSYSRGEQRPAPPSCFMAIIMSTRKMYGMFSNMIFHLFANK